MRVWKIKPAPSNKDEVWWRADSPCKSMWLFNGLPVEDVSVLGWLKEKKPFKKDLHWFEPGAPVISDRAFGALESLIAPYVQFVRVDVGGGAWLVNPTVVLDCLGPLADVSYLFDDPESRAIKKVNSFDFVPDRVTAPIFKIRGLEIDYCLCTDEFVEKVMAAGLEGFQFVLAWDSECPPGSIRFWGFFEVGDYYVNSGKRGKACLPRENPDAFGQKLVPLEEPPAAPAPSAAGGPAAAEPAALEPAAPSGAKAAPAPYDGPALDDDIRAVREEALASLPGLPAAAGELSDGPCGALGSRVCGSPAMLPGEEWPEGPGGEPLCFLAQLDMADLPPLPGFPGKGLLRLFVGEEPEFGLDPSDMAAQAGFRALWAPDPEGAALGAAPEGAEDGLGWGDGPWAVRFGGPFPSRPEDFDARAQSAFAALWNAARPDLPVSGTQDAGRYASDRSLPLELAIQAEEEAGDPPAVQVGGYPSFVQADDRRSWEERYRRYDALLFQLSSDHGRYIEMGDGGRMYFFIPSGNLAAGDFSDIMYWWDCG